MSGSVLEIPTHDLCESPSKFLWLTPLPIFSNFTVSLFSSSLSILLSTYPALTLFSLSRLHWISRSHSFFCILVEFSLSPIFVFLPLFHSVFDAAPASMEPLPQRRRQRTGGPAEGEPLGCWFLALRSSLTHYRIWEEERNRKKINYDHTHTHNVPRVHALK